MTETTAPPGPITIKEQLLRSQASTFVEAIDEGDRLMLDAFKNKYANA